LTRTAIPYLTPKEIRVFGACKRRQVATVKRIPHPSLHVAKEIKGITLKVLLLFAIEALSFRHISTTGKFVARVFASDLLRINHRSYARFMQQRRHPSSQRLA
jgi:hypothetical protein